MWRLLLLLALPLPAPSDADAPVAPMAGSLVSGTWEVVPATVGIAAVRHAHSAIHDPVANRVILFGGSNGSTLRNELFEMDVCGLPGLRLLAAQGTAPSARHSHAAIYDPVRHRMIVFGGDDGMPRNQVFALDLASDPPAWSQLSPAGTPPGGRSGHSAIYDPIRDRVIVFGGGNNIVWLNDVWELRLSGTPEWAPLAPSGTPPSVRNLHSAIYDPVRDRMVVFGGNSGGNALNDLWALDLSGPPAWSPLAASGDVPIVRMAHAALYDAAEDRMLVIAGAIDAFFHLGDSHQLRFSPGPAWSPSETFIGWGSSRAMVLIPSNRRVISHGGKDRDSSFSAVLELVLPGIPGWTRRPAQHPSYRHSHVAVFDPPRGRFLLHGGDGGFSASLPLPLGDVLEMPANGPATWTRPCVIGPEPYPRFGHAAVYDPMRDRVLMFGGYDGNFLNDVLSLSLGSPITWTPIATSGTPPPTRDFASLVYDPVRDRLVLFGGNRPGALLNDVWALDLAGATPTWTPLNAIGMYPSMRMAHGAVFDAARDRLIVFGGYDSAPLNDLWALPFSGPLQWVQLFPGGTLPSPRSSASLVLDPVRDRLVLFGGIGTESSGETWELPLSGTFAWNLLTPTAGPPPPRHGHIAVYDPINDRMLVSGGFTTGGPDAGRRADSWALVWGDVVSVEPPGGSGLAFEGVWPNPSADRPLLVFSLPARSRVDVRLFDVAGRQVDRMGLGTLTAGTHRVPLQRVDRLPTGLYLVQLETGFGVLRRRWTRLR